MAESDVVFSERCIGGDGQFGNDFAGSAGHNTLDGDTGAEIEVGGCTAGRGSDRR